MDSTNSSSKASVEQSGLNKKCKEGRTKDGYYQRNGQSLTRFILSNGELPEKQLHLLRHPKTGNPTLYAIGNKRVEELLRFDDGLRSVLLGDNVISNGSLILLVPVSPALLLLPYLQKYAKDDFVSLKDILVDDCFPSIKLLENVKAVKSSLKHACHCKEISNVETYKYSESLLVDYITHKIKLIKNSHRYKSDFDHVVCGILEENLPTDILRLVKFDFVRGRSDDAPSNKRRKNRDSESREEKKISGIAIEPLRDPIAVEVPVKYTRLRNGKVFTL
uniref:RNase_H2-Ydr279 domain-containing protein n=1 Tax=Loa loa TaxID=7209 RepID=A0A1I7V5A5_LOALO